MLGTLLNFLLKKDHFYISIITASLHLIINVARKNYVIQYIFYSLWYHALYQVGIKLSIKKKLIVTRGFSY